jgi:hypothetical protein
MKDKIKLLSIKPLRSGNKKYEAKFEIKKSNGKISNKSIKFGAKGMSDFTIHKDTERRDRYISRHKKDLRTNDPKRAGYLSMYILWNKKTFKASLADYKRRLNIYNRTGKFPIAITGSSLKSKFGTISRLDLLPTDIQLQIKNYNDKFNYSKNLLNSFLKDLPLDQVDNRKYNEYSQELLLLIIQIENYLKYLIKHELIQYLSDDIKDYIEILLSNFRFNIDESDLNENQRIIYNRTKEAFSTIKLIICEYFSVYFEDICPRTRQKIENITRFGGKKVTFKEEPMIKQYEIDGILKRNSYPNNKVRITKIKEKIVYIKEYNELSQNFAKFIGDMQYDSLFINRNLDCILYIFKYLFRNFKKITKKDEFIQIFNNIFYANEKKRDESCINDKGVLITTLFDTPKGKLMLEEFNNFVEKKIELKNRMRNSNFGSTYDDLPDDLKKYIFELRRIELQKEKEKRERIKKITKYLKDLDIKGYYNIPLINNYDNLNNFGKYKVPDNVKNKSLYLRIKNKIGKEVKKKGRRWGAYDSGRLVREYKNKGGKYSGKKSTKTKSKKSSNLDRWYREKWIDACAWPKRKSCGRTKASIKSKVTYCRPSKSIDRNTPKTIQELTKAEIKRKCTKKSKNPKKIVK